MPHAGSATGGEAREHVADLERMDEVRRLAAELLDAYPRIDALANNAGAMFTSPHKSGVLDLDDLQSERGRFRPGRVYGTSKLCNVLVTRELQRRNPQIAANCFHPGVIRTGFGKNDGAGRAARHLRGEPAAGGAERPGAGRPPRRGAMGALGGAGQPSSSAMIRAARAAPSRSSGR